MEKSLDWKKYAIVFFITIALFLCAYYVSNYFGNQKISQLKAIQDKISIDILSSETQFSLLSELSCKNISDSVYSPELAELGSKLDWSEKNLAAAEEVDYLKKYYSLLEIKDYLLAKKITTQCGTKSAFVLYFYTTAENCSLCENESMVLASLRDKYPELRVYSFDYNTDLSAVSSMLQIFKIKDTELPAVVIGEEVLKGSRTIDEIDQAIQKEFNLVVPKNTISNSSSKKN